MTESRGLLSVRRAALVFFSPVNILAFLKETFLDCQIHFHRTMVASHDVCVNFCLCYLVLDSV